MFFCALLACALVGDIDMIDGIDGRLLPDKVDVRNGFERLRAGFNSRISRIMKDSGVTDLDIVIEYRRTWFNSIVTIAFSPSFIVVANTHNDKMDYMKRRLSHAEMEQVEAFRISRWEYRHVSGNHICDIPRMYAFRIENGKAVSVQCFEPPLFIDATPKKNSREEGIFANSLSHSTRGASEAGISAVAYDRFVDVVRIFSPLVKDLQLEISSRKSGGWKVISDGEARRERRLPAFKGDPEQATKGKGAMKGKRGSAGSPERLLRWRKVVVYGR